MKKKSQRLIKLKQECREVLRYVSRILVIEAIIIEPTWYYTQFSMELKSKTTHSPDNTRETK